MRKKKLMLLPLSLFLISCNNVNFKVNRFNQVDSNEDLTKVCKLGNLGNAEFGKNLLPTSYWGNYPQEGKIEIGNKAGDPYGEELPEMSISMEKEKNFVFAIVFDSNPLEFPINKENKALGFTFEKIGTDGKLIKKEHYLRGKCLADIFSTKAPEGWLYGESNNDKFNTFESICKASNAYIISFVLKPGEKIKSFTYLYGDIPQKINNVSLMLMQEPMEEKVLMKYEGVDCLKQEYTIECGTNPVYNLKSQYGSVYSLEYLKKSFLAKDRYDGSEITPDIVEDEDNYFTTGASAILGSKFTVKLSAVDSLNNKSTITFNFTVVDEKGPSIIFPSGKEISCSYKTLFDTDKFIDTYLVIADNLDTDLTYEITDMNDNEIKSNKLGNLDLKIKARDLSLNETVEEFKVDCFDDVIPEIDSLADELNLTPFSDYSEDKILNLFTATDEIDGDLPLTIIEDTYTPNKRKIGNYSITVQAVDKSNNKASKTISVNVSDTEGPVFYAKSSNFTVTKDNIPTTEEIISSLIRQEVIPDKNYISWEVIQGREISKDLPLGKHEITLLINADDDTSQTVNLTLNIVEKEVLQIDDVELSFFEKIGEWFKDLWAKIVSFFTGKD